MRYNTAGQRLWLQAFDASGFVEGDTANITCGLSIDGAADVALGNPTEDAGGKGRYYYTLTAAQTRGNELKPKPESSTSGVQVVSQPGTIYTSIIAVQKQIAYPSGLPASVPTVYSFLRPGGVDSYFRPDATSTYLRP